MPTMTPATRSSENCARSYVFSVVKILGTSTLLKQLLLNDQCCDHAVHAMIRLRVRKDMTVERPGTGVVAMDDGIPSFTRRDVECITPVRLGKRPPVLVDDGHMHPVQMHRV